MVNHPLNLKPDVLVLVDPEVPEGVKEVKAICASSEGFAALKSDGTVVSWGIKGTPFVLCKSPCPQSSCLL